MFSDPKILGLAFLGGIVPSLLWLWFWLREEKTNVQPKWLLYVCFIIGMLSVFFILPVEKLIQNTFGDKNLQIVLWASAEELIKYLAVLVILFKTDYVDDPLDWPIMMITAALGFAALENMLFLIKPTILLSDQVTLGILRYLGSTLLHSVASGIIGISLGLAFYMNSFQKKLHLLIGTFVAIALHSVFNFFIMDSSVLQVLAFLWVVTIIIMLLFEKLRRML